MAVAEAEVRQSGRVLGRVAYRGDHDPHARYAPGDVVLSDGVPYLNTKAIGHLPAVTDTFARREGRRTETWGRATSGQLWVPVLEEATSAAARIRKARGQIALSRTGLGSAQTMRAAHAFATHSRELLVSVRIEAEPAPGAIVAQVILAGNADFSAATQVNVSRVDTETLQLALTLVGTATGPDTEVAQFTYALGDTVWLRVRSDSTNVTARTWAVGTSEPTGWLTSLGFDNTAWGGFAALGATLDTVGDAVSFDALSVRDLSAEDAPADDTGFWTPLADAFPAPVPA